MYWKQHRTEGEWQPRKSVSVQEDLRKTRDSEPPVQRQRNENWSMTQKFLQNPCLPHKIAFMSHPQGNQVVLYQYLIDWSSTIMELFQTHRGESCASGWRLQSNLAHSLHLQVSSEASEVPWSHNPGQLTFLAFKTFWNVFSGLLPFRFRHMILFSSTG